MSEYLPSGWKSINANKIFSIQGGYAFKSEDAVVEGARWLKIANVGFGKILWEEKSFLPPCYLKEHQNFCLSTGDLVVAMTRPLLSSKLKIAKVTDDDTPALLNQRVGKIVVYGNILNDYLYHVLCTEKIAYKLESDLLGTDPPNLSIKTFHGIKLLIPPLPEQTAIASLLSTWDLAIEMIERLIAAKEERFTSLTQGLIHSCTEGLRHVHLRDICEPVTRKNSINELNVLTTSAQHGLISQMDYYKKSVSAEDVRGYYLLKNGEFAYNRSSSNGYPYGAIKRLDGYPQGVLSTLYLCFSLKSGARCDSDFMAHAFEAGLLNKQLVGVCQEGARSHGLLNITKTDFFGLKLALPAFSEQQRIAAILSTARQEIDLLKKQAEAYRRQKRGLMQRLLTGEWRVKTDKEAN